MEDTLNALLDAEADQLCNAERYERTQSRRDTRAGNYERKLQTKTGEVKLKVPKLRQKTFETAIIERYRRREWLYAVIRLDCIQDIQKLLKSRSDLFRSSTPETRFLMNETRNLNGSSRG